MPRAFIGSLFPLLLLAVVVVLLDHVADGAQGGLQVTPEELRDDLSERLPDSILKEGIGSIEILDREEDWIVVWIAVNLGEFEDHSGSTEGNLIYFTFVDKETFDHRTVLLPVSVSTIKRDLRIFESPTSDGYRLVWLEEYELWTCLWEDGETKGVHKVLEGEFTTFDLVQVGDGYDLYTVSEDLRELYWCRIGNPLLVSRSSQGGRSSRP